MMPGHMRGFGSGGDAGTGASSPPLASAQEAAVEAGDLWFRPATLAIPAGLPVNITVTNSGRVFHDFTVDALDLRLRGDPGGTAIGASASTRPASTASTAASPAMRRQACVARSSLWGARDREAANWARLRFTI